MDLPPDFRDLLEELARDAVEFVLVGGYAVAFHARPRATKDIDILLDGSLENLLPVRIPEYRHAACSRRVSQMPGVVHMRALRMVAHRSLPRAIAMLEARGGVLAQSVYVAMDARTRPGRDLAIHVLAEREHLEAPEARNVLDSLLHADDARGLPTILTAVVSQHLLVAAITTSRIARDIRRFIARDVPRSHCRIIAIAGRRLEMELVPLGPEASVS